MAKQLQPPIFLEYLRGPKLTFTNSLPIRLKSIQTKNSHLLKTRIGKFDTISEIVLLENFSMENINDIQIEINKFNESENKDLSLVNSRSLRNAIDVAFFHFDLFQGDENENIFKTPIPLCKPKIKIGPDHLEQIKKVDHKPSRLDANQSFTHMQFNNFINELTSNFINQIEFIEEPLQLTDIHHLESYKDKKISFAIDESLESIWNNPLKRDLLNHFHYLIIKPSMTPLNLLKNINSKYPHLKFVLSCLYEGPWNLKYFWKIHKDLNIQTLSGLYPLVNISENQKYISIKNSNQLTLSY